MIDKFDMFMAWSTFIICMLCAASHWGESVGQAFAGQSMCWAMVVYKFQQCRRCAKENY